MGNVYKIQTGGGSAGAPEPSVRQSGPAGYQVGQGAYGEDGQLPQDFQKEGKDQPTVKVGPAEKKVYTTSSPSSPVVSIGVERFVAGENESPDPLVHGKDATGRFLARSELTEDSRVVGPGGVEGQVKSFVTLGILEKDPQGGYRWAEQPKETPPDSQQEAPQQMERLSEESESFLGQTLQEVGEQTWAGVANTIIAAHGELDAKSVAPMLSDLASRLHVEPGQVNAQVTKVLAEFTAQAKRAVSQVGVDAESWDGFVKWAWSNKSAAIQEAMSRQSLSGDLSVMKALAKEFVSSGEQFDEEAVLDEKSELGGGITAFRDNSSGKVILRIPGHGEMTYRQAVNLGIVRVSRK